MNFRDSYKQINENRNPDKEFLNQLAEKWMHSNKKAKKITPYPL